MSRRFAAPLLLAVFGLGLAGCWENIQMRQNRPKTPPAGKGAEWLDLNRRLGNDVALKPAAAEAPAPASGAAH